MFPFQASLPRAAPREFRAARIIANHIVSRIDCKTVFIYITTFSGNFKKLYSGCQKEKAAGNAPEDSAQSGIGPISSKGRSW
jgi:hypothetical protein